MENDKNFYKAYLVIEKMPWLKSDRILMDFQTKEEAEKEVERLNSKTYGGNYYVSSLPYKLFQIHLNSNE